MPCRICLRKNMKVFYRINIDFIDLMEKLSEMKVQVNDTVCCYCLATLRRIQKFANTAKELDSLSKLSIKTEEDEIFSNKLYNYTVTAREHISIENPRSPCKTNTSNVGTDLLIEIERDPLLKYFKDEPFQSTENMDGNKIDNQSDSEDDVPLAGIAVARRENEPLSDYSMDTDSPEELTPTDVRDHMDLEEFKYGREKIHDDAKYRKIKASKRAMQQCDRNKVEKALEKIKRNGLSVRAASRICDVPRSSLQYRLSGRTAEDALKMGTDPVLGFIQEGILVQWLMMLAKCGYFRKRSDLMSTIENVLKDVCHPSPFKDDLSGRKWYNLFLSRHPSLKEKALESVNNARSTTTERSIRKWFTDLKSFLSETNSEDILSNPARILNGDEISFALCPKSGRVIAPKKWKNVYEIKKGSEKETITTFLVISATGEIMDPLVVFPYAREPPKQIVFSTPKPWYIGVSESGWMNSEIFYEYIANYVNNYVTEKCIQKPVILLIDGLKSHLTKELSIFCEENGIILYALPPKTAHIMRPADASVFRPLKQEWKTSVRQWRIQQNKRILKKTTFSPLLKYIFNRDFKECITNGFKKCGLYPFDPNAVDYTNCFKNITNKDFLTTIKAMNLCKKELLENRDIDGDYIINIVKEKIRFVAQGQEGDSHCTASSKKFITDRKRKLNLTESRKSKRRKTR